MPWISCMFHVHYHKDKSLLAPGSTACPNNSKGLAGAKNSTLWNGRVRNGHLQNVLFVFALSLRYNSTLHSWTLATVSICAYIKFYFVKIDQMRHKNGIHCCIAYSLILKELKINNRKMTSACFGLYTAWTIQITI